MTLTPEKLAELREKAQAAESFTAGKPWSYDEEAADVHNGIRERGKHILDYGASFVVCDPAMKDDNLDRVAAFGRHIAAAAPQTVLALVEEVERLRDIESDLLVCEADCRDLQSFVAELRDSNAKITDARDNLLDEVGRLRAKNAAYHERLHYPCDGCPGCSSGDCPDALHIAQIDLAVWQHEAKRLRARVAELEAAMAQRMGVYAAPKDERQVGS